MVSVVLPHSIEIEKEDKIVEIELWIAPYSPNVASMTFIVPTYQKNARYKAFTMKK